jgi:hypothetical protein
VVSPTREPGAGRWPFPRPPHGLGANALTFEGTRFRRTKRSGVTASTTLLTFVVLRGPFPARAAFPHRRRRWPGREVQAPTPPDRSGHLSPFSKIRPSADMAAARPLPAGRPRRDRPAFGSELPPSEHVPPLPFLPASTVCAASASCGFVAPRSRPWGSPRFGLRTSDSREREYVSRRLPQ